MKRWMWALASAGVLAMMVAAAMLVRRTDPHALPDHGVATRPAPTRDRGGGVHSRDADPKTRLRVQGWVLDRDGEPLPDGGAVVLACLESTPIEGSGVVRLGEDGSFDAPAPCTDVCVTLAHAAYVADEPWLVQPGVPATLLARPLARLHGRVEDVHGRPLAAARVTFVPPDVDDDEPTSILPLATRSTVTDVDGHFSVAWIDQPPCGPCDEARARCTGGGPFVHERVRVVALANGHAAHEHEVAVADPRFTDPDAPLVLVLSPATGTLEAHVHDPRGDPYPRAFAIARSLVRSYEIHRADATDGVYTFTGLGDGPYVVRVLQDGLELAVASPVQAGQTIALVGSHETAARKLVVEVLAREPDGREAPRAGVRVDGGPFVDATTDGRGRVEAFEVLAGDYTLVARAPGLAASEWPIHVTAPSTGAAVAEEIVRRVVTTP